VANFLFQIWQQRDCFTMHFTGKAAKGILAKFIISTSVVCCVNNNDYSLRRGVRKASSVVIATNLEAFELSSKGIHLLLLR
jgi:hypothetical protein